MGLRSSRPVGSSPSAAFGRLRIDSPRPRRRSSGARSPAAGRGTRKVGSFNDLSKQQQKQQQDATEESPLLRKFESIPSSDDFAADDTFVPPVPPCYIWIGPALICALAYAMYNIFIKLGSYTMHPILGGVILQFVAAVLGTFLLLVLIWKEGGMQDMKHDKAGVRWSICAGAAVGAAEILSFIVSGMGVQAMQSIPIIIGGSVLFGTTLGYAVLSEALSPRGWFGVFLIATGIALVGMDPNGGGME